MGHLRRLTGIVVLAAAVIAATLSLADDYPTHPVRIIIGFGAGASADTPARLLAQKFSDALGQQFLVENRPGAGSNVAAEYVARAPNDGYTIFMATAAQTNYAGMTIHTIYDVVKDFAPIALCGDIPLVLVAKKIIPADDLRGYIAWLKTNPGKASMGTVGVGSPLHLLGVLMQKETGARFTLVPYRGAGPMVQDIVAGQIDLGFANTATVLPFVRAASIKAFGLTSLKRMAAAPEIPTMDEAGLSGFSFSLWAALFATRGTPKGIIDKLNTAVVNTLLDPNVRQKLEVQGFEIPPRERQTPEALGAYQKAEIEKWWPIIKSAGIQVE